MQLSRYQAITLCIFILATSLILLLGVRLVNSGPRVRFVEYDQVITNGHAHKNATLTIHFDRPIIDSQVEPALSFSPTTDFDVSVRGQSAIVTLNENLLGNTSYTLIVADTIRDRQGNQMSTPFTESFQTAQASFVYLERNYPTSEGQAEPDDYIKLSSTAAERESEIVYSHPIIRDFVANERFIVVVTTSDDGQRDELTVINRRSKEERQIDIESDGKITNLVLGPRSDRVVLTSQPNLTVVSSEYFNRFSQQITSVHLETGELQGYSDDNGQTLRADQLHIDNQGQLVLARTIEGAYVALSPFGNFAPILLGSFGTSYGFDQSAENIIFRNDEQLSSYSVSTSELTEIDPGVPGFIQEVSARHGQTLFTSSLINGQELQTTLYQLQEPGESPREIWQEASSNGQSLATFIQSYDNRYFALTYRPINCRFDTLNPGGECRDAFTEIYDSITERVVQSFQGFNVTWLP